MASTNPDYNKWESVNKTETKYDNIEFELYIKQTNGILMPFITDNIP